MRATVRKTTTSLPPLGTVFPASLITQKLELSLRMEPSKRPCKRTKKKGETTTSVDKLGRRSIITLPVEVLLQIADCLNPGDLLALSRSCKNAGRVFASKRTQSIWTRAEKAENLPPRPSDLNSLQYASLVFDSYCMACSCKNGYMDFLMRLRLCNKCEKELMVPIDKYIPKENQDYPTLLMAIPNTYSNVIIDLYNLQGPDWHTHYRMYGKPKCFDPELQSFLADYKAMRNMGTCNDFLAKKVQDIRQRNDFNYEIIVWARAKIEEKKAAKRAKKERRVEEIFKRLRDLGYTDIDLDKTNDEPDMKWDAMIYQYRELTERAWNGLRKRLEDIIRRRRETRERIARERCIAVRKGLILDAFLKLVDGKIVSMWSIACPLEDFMKLPSVDEYLYAEGLGTTIPSDTIFIEALVNNMGRGTALAQKCAIEMRDSLYRRGLLPYRIGDEEIGEDTNCVLGHSCAFFRYAKRGKKPMLFSEIIGLIGEESLDTYYHPSRSGQKDHIDYMSEDIRPYDEAIEVACRLERMAGKIEFTTSDRQMDPLAIAWSKMVEQYTGDSTWLSTTSGCDVNHREPMLCTGLMFNIGNQGNGSSSSSTDLSLDIDNYFESDAWLNVGSNSGYNSEGDGYELLEHIRQGQITRDYSKMLSGQKLINERLLELRGED